MTGKSLKEKLEREGITITKLARKLGITEEHVYSKLKAKDIKVSFLQKIASVTNKSVFYWIGEEPSETEKDVEILELLRENRQLRMRIEELEANSEAGKEKLYTLTKHKEGK